MLLLTLISVHQTNGPHWTPLNSIEPHWTPLTPLYCDLSSGRVRWSPVGLWSGGVFQRYGNGTLNYHTGQPDPLDHGFSSVGFSGVAIQCGISTYPYFDVPKKYKNTLLDWFLYKLLTLFLGLILRSVIYLNKFNIRNRPTLICVQCFQKYQCFRPELYAAIRSPVRSWWCGSPMRYFDAIPLTA